MVATTEAQLYTIEGVAAAILMVVTAYLILNTTFILTPGDTHINDMQLEQLGNDILRMMDTADKYDDEGVNYYENKSSFLEKELSKSIIDPEIFTKKFIDEFHYYAGDNNLKMSASAFYRNGTAIMPLPLFWDAYAAPPLTNRDHYVKVTRWVHLHNPQWGDNQPKTVLLEVLLWRD